MKAFDLAQTRKQLAFDIDTKELKKYYPKSNWRYAYKLIKKFMLENGFIWLQGSVYVSMKPITNMKAISIITKLVEKYPYLNKAVRDMTVTEISELFSLNFLFNKDYKMIKQ